MSNENYRNAKGWKQHRKAQYRIKKVHKNKKRKPREKEHWRDKKHYHGWKFGFGLRNWGRTFRREQRLDAPKWTMETLRFMEHLEIGEFVKGRLGWSSGESYYKVSKFNYEDWGKEETLYLMLTQQVEGNWGFGNQEIINVEKFHRYFTKKTYKKDENNNWK